MTLNFIILFICLFIPSMMLLSFGILTLLQNFFSAPYVPSSAKKLAAALEELGLPQAGRFIDLGSGDGGITLMAAKYFHQSSGVEINPYLWLFSNLRKLFHPKRKNIHFICKSFFRMKFHDYDVMYIYLFPELMAKLEDKLFAELPKGSTIISHTFKFPNHQPERTINKHYHIYSTK